MKIGLVGEAPNDTTSIKNVLVKKYSEQEHTYIPMLDRINGSQLDSQKTKRLLRIEYEIKQPDVIVFIRDLDGLINDKEKLANRKAYFTEFNSVVDKKGVFLLNIFEIESFVLSHLDCFNNLFGTNHTYDADPMEQIEPKEFLKTLSNKYNESYNPELFAALDFDKAINCKFFSIFLNKFDKITSAN